MLVVPQDDRAVADGGGVPLCALDEARRAVRKVVDDLRVLLVQRIEVDDVHVRPFADGERAAVLQAENPGRRRGDTAHGLANRVEPGVPAPMRKDEGRPPRVHDLADMRAGIAESREAVVAREQMRHRLQVLVERAQREERPAAAVERHAQERLGRVFEPRFGQLGKALIRRANVVRLVAIAHPEEVFRRRSRLLLCFGDESCAGIGVPDRIEPRGEVELAQFDPSRGAPGEAALQARDEPGAPRRRNGTDVEAVGVHPVEHGPHASARCVLGPRGDAEQHAAAECPRLLAQEFCFALEVATEVEDVLHQAASGTDFRRDRLDLPVLRVRARNVAAVRHVVA